MKSSIPPLANRQAHENGRAWLEYGVVIGLVLLTLGTLIAWFGPQIQESLRSAIAPTPSPTPPPIVYEVLETGTFAEILATEVITATNCVAADDLVSDLVSDVLRTRPLEHEIILEGVTMSDTIKVLTEQIQAYYELSAEEVEEKEFTFRLPVSPETQTNRVIEWQYIWKVGQVIITRPDGREQRYDFRMRADLEWSTISETSEPISCQEAPTP